MPYISGIITTPGAGKLAGRSKNTSNDFPSKESTVRRSAINFSLSRFLSRLNEGAGFIDDFAAGVVDGFSHRLCDVLPALRQNSKLHLGGLGKEIGIAQHLCKCRAQETNIFGRHSRRKCQATTDYADGRKEIHNGKVLSANKRSQHWHRRCCWIRLHSDLQDRKGEIGFLLEPSRYGVRPHLPGKYRPVYLFAFDGVDRVARTLEAADKLHFQTQQALGYRGNHQ